jgi:hypothetical protein
MYSQAYRNRKCEVDKDLNITFISETLENVKRRTQNHEKIKVIFSIMEIEAWIISMHDIFNEMNVTKNLTVSESSIISLLGCDYWENPESIFHPAE